MKEIRPIAFFRSPLTSKFGVPRQSGLADNLVGRIVFEPQYQREEALRGLEGFDYLWLIWGFSANKSTDDGKLTVRPPRLGGNERLGVFATRSPFRPNGLGLSSVRIKQITDSVIEVVGADLMDGTPIYDVKPYIPYVDSHPEAKGGFTDKKAWQKLSVMMSDEYARCFEKEELAALKEVLAQDPRPQYQHDTERVYGMPFGGKDVRFRVDGDVLEIVGIE
ncbi:tRNA (N6-threonylcarbamoyladenosine(37)-N6)-methyltransferase TrmO [Prevotella fusca]|uniref:Methyltransferase n=1 Tax=Prevotella fusca JCM 17724 TaxID=1236517 RepID=A0A0K1NM28_9BACT|nr:tRNA (N6-threonylcarbamoyladenosine(37)-N6)-methyltransferase TrmO [Prevotella fusca]AKU70090.1 methyltransferase [Prevotella fusca JCM 17724]QUB85699.1 tRNA (N6-threonylcarbamoyladenosine(37)-N6)-methyltransferase TrmO [Prevotella fusca JCM 17724]